LVKIDAKNNQLESLYRIVSNLGIIIRKTDMWSAETPFPSDRRTDEIHGDSGEEKMARKFPGLVAGAILLGALSWTPAAQAADPLKLSVDEMITPDFITEVRQWATAPVVVSALTGRKELYGKLPPDNIDILDKQWRAEREVDDQPLITSVLANPLSSYLIRVQANSVGLFTEIFVMDTNGLNAGQSSVTSDYWQGDEGKFQKTYDVGPNAVFVDEAEFHEGTQTWRAQLNMTVTDPQGAQLGAITVEVNLTELERRIQNGVAS